MLDNIKMMVVGDNAASPCGHCTINEFVVIGVRCNKVKMVKRRYKLYKGTVDKSFDDIFRNLYIDKPLHNLKVFLKNAIGDAQRVLPRLKRFPHDMVFAS